MIYKLQTKSDNITIDPIKQIKGRVILTIKEIIFNGLSYKAKIEYSVGNGVVIREDISTFTTKEADYLFDAFQNSGNTFSQKFTNLICKASGYQLENSGILGLTSDDWEEYVEPVYEPTPEEEIIEE